LIGRDANEIQPGKRMLSSMTPTIVKKDGRVVLVTGSPGGATIINTVLQVVLNVLDHDMSAEQAVASPRIHHQWQSAIPSRFVEELPREQVELESESGLYGGSVDSAFQEVGGAFVAQPARGGPGWQRLQSRGPGSRLIEAEPEILHGSGAGFARGDRCFHQKFGMGSVRTVEGDHLTIEFDNAGTKKVVAAFVEKS